MTQFVQHNLRNGETVSSVIILLEAEFSQMRDEVSPQWIVEVEKGRVGY
jgi:hypothetical protein